jgi:hypothetical protein
MGRTILGCRRARGGPVKSFAPLSLFLLLSCSGPGASTSPRTSFGDPDLQGLWTNASMTILFRMPGVKSLVASPEEAARIEGAIRDWQRAHDVPGTREDVRYFPFVAKRLTDGAWKAPRGSAPPPGVGGYDTGWYDMGSSLATVRGEKRTSWIVDPPDGEIPYTAEGERHREAGKRAFDHDFDGPESRSPAERCLLGYGSTAGPPMLNVMYNNFYQIVQTPGFVVIVTEMIHDARIVRLNGTHLPPNIRPWLGDSVGHWEGDTLVVETTNLPNGQAFNPDGRYNFYLSPDSRVTEKFTRTGPGEILYSFRVEEPRAYARPWSGEIPLRAAKGPMYEYSCQEENFGTMTSILLGARREEGHGNREKR